MIPRLMKPGVFEPRVLQQLQVRVALRFHSDRKSS